MDSDDLASGNIDANDDQTDGPGFFLFRINGDLINPAMTTNVTWASGAKLTVTAVGNFVYNPDGAFDDDAFFGATTFDTFSDTVADGAVIGGTGNDFATGCLGDDSIMGDEGADVLDGGGRDMASGGRGRDDLTGGAGVDVFEFASGDGRDVITDFRQGADRIQITRRADEFSDLSVRQIGDDVLIGFTNVRILVEDQDVADFGANDFIFGG